MKHLGACTHMFIHSSRITSRKSQGGESNCQTLRSSIFRVSCFRFQNSVQNQNQNTSTRGTSFFVFRTDVIPQSEPEDEV